MFRRIAAVGALALVLTAPAAQAHHSYAMFDRSKTVTGAALTTALSS